MRKGEKEVSLWYLQNTKEALVLIQLLRVPGTR